MEKSAGTGFSHSLVLYQKSHSFAALTRSISDTSPSRVKIPYARAFHEVISICITALACKTQIVITLTTDASKSGWGVVCNEVSTSDQWSSNEQALHILNCLELIAILFGVQCFV